MMYIYYPKVKRDGRWIKLDQPFDMYGMAEECAEEFCKETHSDDYGVITIEGDIVDLYCK